MDDSFDTAVKTICERFGASAGEFRGETTLIIAAEKNVEIFRTLKAEFGFDTLPVLTAVDYYPRTAERFHVVYVVYSTKTHRYLNLRAAVEGSNPEIQTVESVYPGANWREREVWDLFGIRFKGHSDLRRIMMPPNWQGHPLRKDYSLGYEEVEYTFNYNEIQAKKPHGER